MNDWLLLLYPGCAILGAIVSLLLSKRLTLTPIRLNGSSLTDGLRAFNEWRDDFLIELSTLMLMVGFVIGTVDVFTSGGLSNVPTFNYAWAIIQAIAIDGLFFAVWGRIKRATWSWAKAFNNIMLIVVGLLLAIVASLVNGLLSYQELNHVSNVAQAMTSLGVDQSTFTYARAILVVLVSVLVALFGRTYTQDKKATEQQLSVAQAEVDRVTELNNGLQATAKELQATIDGLRAELAQALTAKRSPRSRAMVAQSQEAIVIAERATGYESTGYVAQNAQATGYSENGLQAMNGISHSPEEKATESTIAQAGGLRATNTQGYVAQDDGSTIAVANGDGQVMIATGSHRDRIKQAMLQAMIDGKELDYKDIAQVAQVGYSTVKKYAPEIREELAQIPEAQPESKPSETAKLALTLEALNGNPDITDEELAQILNMQRPASARFWKLKARELLAQDTQAEVERNTDSLERVAARV